MAPMPPTFVPSPVRPKRLRRGDTVAVVTPSWSGPQAFPHVFDRGLDALRSLGLEVREMPATRSRNPDPLARVADLHAAFEDASTAGVFCAIGGDDSVRLLPYLDRELIAANPKIVVGFSDNVTILAAVRRAGIVSFHGPSIMAGFAQMDAFEPAFRCHVEAMLFEPADAYAYEPYQTLVEGYPDWGDPAKAGFANPPQPDDGPHVLQGSGRVTGELFGGCLEVLDWLRGTWAWPATDEWHDRLLMIEPSEDKPSPLAVTQILRGFGVLGVFDRIAGVIVGRPRDHDPEERRAFEAAVLDVIAGEFGRRAIAIVANLPFGHTDPQWILPIGVRAELDADRGTLRLVEPWLA
jgi:muramoyltetrapeptide carboxypeptidase LdcA involved in peptidoglycan recycling